MHEIDGAWLRRDVSKEIEVAGSGSPHNLFPN